MDFDDLERGADRALEHEHVRRAYHERFALVLVDEFQDTNPVQARLIRKFARPDASNLCVVGRSQAVDLPLPRRGRGRVRGVLLEASA